jgi:hypothetical protein
MSPYNMPGLAQTAPRGTALLTPHHGARWGRVISAMVQSPYPWHPLLIGWVGPWAGLDRYGEDKICCLHRGSNPGLYST